MVIEGLLVIGILRKLEEKCVASKGRRLLLDLSKKFDYLPHNPLLVILHAYIELPNLNVS